ncbi:HpsJ-like protein, cyanoexosortase A-associated [Tumidithrix helvetica]|uniref:HpsJ-like protein, cyanoexosortase A-associated n=1 Tax=Tumidithrix helvetica TaxID=3457545 RepID=UPI003CC5E8D8
MTTNSNNDLSASLLRFVGYGLLLLTISNFGDALIPPRFTDETWVFQTLGSLVGSVPVPILGLVFVFYGESKARTSLGKSITKLLSWLSLLLAIFFIAMMFAGISVTIRINNNNNTEANFQLSRQASQFQQAMNNLKNVSDADLVKGATALQQQNSGVKLDLSNPQALRKQLETEFTKKDAAVKDGIENAKRNAFRRLIKQSVKWNFEALVSAGLFFGIWRITGWARAAQKRKKRPRSAPSLDDLVDLPTTNTSSSSESQDDVK